MQSDGATGPARQACTAAPGSGPDGPSDPDGRTKRWLAAVREAEATRPPMRGYYHRNYRWALTPELAADVDRQPGQWVKLRLRLPGAFSYDLQLWPDEDALLDRLAQHIPDVPVVLFRQQGLSVHTYAEGRALADRKRRSLPARHIRAMAGFFRTLVTVDTEVLPGCRPDWPRDGDTTGFLHQLIDFTLEDVVGPLGETHGDLFTWLGIPGDALLRLKDRLGTLRSRPFALLHGDVHRGNIIRTPGKGGGLRLIDWELAMLGDPVYDLAVHLVNMRYPRRQWRSVVAAWEAAVSSVAPEFAAGARDDLDKYVAYRRVHSAYTDTVREAHRIGATPNPLALVRAALRIRRVLLKGRQALGMPRTPSRSGVAWALFRWSRTVKARQPVL